MGDKTTYKSIVVFGEPDVGKTCFCDMVTHQASFVYHHATAPEKKKIVVGNTIYSLDLLDVRSNYRDESEILNARFVDQWLQLAAGVVLLFDLTSKTSFDKIVDDGHLTVCKYRKSHNDQGIPYPCGGQRFGCVLVGTKADLAIEKREVNREHAEEWAQSQGIRYFELDKSQPKLLEEAMRALVLSIVHAERRDAEDTDNANTNEPKTEKKGKDRMASLTQSLRTAFRK